MSKQKKPPFKIKGCKILHSNDQKPNVIRWSEYSNPKDFSIRPVADPVEIARLNRLYRPFGKWAIDPALICELDMKACGLRPAGWCND